MGVQVVAFLPPLHSLRLHCGHHCLHKTPLSPACCHHLHSLSISIITLEENIGAKSWFSPRKKMQGEEETAAVWNVGSLGTALASTTSTDNSESIPVCKSATFLPPHDKTPTDRAENFKSIRDYDDQNKRRRKLLAKQKASRRSIADHVRSMTEQQDQLQLESPARAKRKRDAIEKKPPTYTRT